MTTIMRTQRNKTYTQKILDEVMSDDRKRYKELFKRPKAGLNPSTTGTINIVATIGWLGAGIATTYLNYTNGHHVGFLAVSLAYFVAALITGIVTARNYELGKYDDANDSNYSYKIPKFALNKIPKPYAILVRASKPTVRAKLHTTRSPNL